GRPHPADPRHPRRPGAPAAVAPAGGAAASGGRGGGPGPGGGGAPRVRRRTRGEGEGNHAPLPRPSPERTASPATADGHEARHDSGYSERAVRTVGRAEFFLATTPFPGRVNRLAFLFPIPHLPEQTSWTRWPCRAPAGGREKKFSRRGSFRKIC